MSSSAAQKRVAIVTGGGSGIGRAAAVAFARDGAFVIVADRDEAAGAHTTALIGAERSTFVATDVSNEADVERLFGEAERVGTVQSVHNNAGVIMPDCDLHELTREAWERLLSVNLTGAWLVLRQAIIAMRARGGGAVVNTCSVGGVAAIPGRAAYSASKAGLLMLTKSAALENGGHGIRVNAVAPGTIATPMVLERPFPGGGEPVGPPPTRRMGQPEEVAEAVVWLCSDAASYVNGACITVDGGWTTSVPARR
jgi:NAD(P)-dependent dehydrogenase (short-subunit alcohol dehydrogenase family)